MLRQLIPPAKRGARKRGADMREVVNCIMSILGTGCQWQEMPRDLPKRRTVHSYLKRWEPGGTLQKIHRALYQACREKAGREASPTARIIDSQSVKGAEKGGKPIDSKGYDAA